MRWGRFIAGLILLLVGILLVVSSVLANGGTTSITVPAGDQAGIQVKSLTSVQIEVQWSGGTSGTTAFLVSGTPGCVAPSGVAGQGTGAAGAFSASLSPGVTYLLYACASGSYRTLTFSYTVSGGLSILELIGVLLLLVGLLLLYLGVRRPNTERDARLEHAYSRGHRDDPFGDSSRSRPAPSYAPRARPTTVRSADPPARPSPPAASSGRPATWPASPDGRTWQGCRHCGRLNPYGRARCEGCGHPL